MERRSQRRAYAVTVLAAAVLLLGGCGSAKPEPGVASVGGGAPSTGPADRDTQIARYRECLTRNGVDLLDTPTAEGLPQVDKQSTDAGVLGEAQQRCREHVPSGGDATRAPTADIETSRRYAACLREHGVADYPDPDPVTGDPGLSDELGARLKADPDMADATEACAGLQPGGKGDVGA